MVSYEIRPLQLRILEILEAIDKVCRENNLRYYIIAGTLLGAVRHKGFIPWDDDMDIAMPRKDYDFLMSHCKELMPERFEVRCMENVEEFSAPFAKVFDTTTTLIEKQFMDTLYGIYIDIFPLDGVPNGKIAQWWHFFRYQYYKKANYFIYRDPYKHGHGPASWLPLLFRKMYSRQEMKGILRRLLTAYDYDKSELVVDHDDGWKGVMRKEVFGNAVEVSFEGKNFLAPEKKEQYLEQKYGDYMTIPPHEKRHQHNFYYLDLDKPFKDFKPEDLDGLKQRE